MYGRVRIYNPGFVVFTVGAIALSLDPFIGAAGALWLILWRVFQGVGGAMLFANSTAILTDAFPADRRGMALGINQVAAIAGSLHRPDPRRPARRHRLAGGVLRRACRSASSARSGPTSRCTRSATRNPGRLDWPGNLTFARRADLAADGASPTASSPTATHATGWPNPWVLGGIVGGVVLLGVSSLVELRVAPRCSSMRLFRVRAFAMANLAGLLASVGRGGLQFMLIIWLQGIWLPLHGYAYEDTPALGRHLPAAAHRRLPDRRTGLGHPVRPLRRPRPSRPAGCCWSRRRFIALLLIPVDFALPGVRRSSRS